MKRKTKKILATLGVSLMIGAGAIGTTGCKSDINFNQADLDKTIANINEYVIQQNNYSSEFAYNSLMDNVINSLEGFKDTISYFMNGKFYRYDNQGVLEEEGEGEFKQYVSLNSVKRYVSQSQGGRNSKIYCVGSKNTDYSYDLHWYDLNDETYIKYDDIADNDVLLRSIGMSPKDVLNMILIMVNGENANITMEKISDAEYIYKIVQIDEENSSTNILEVTFKDYKVVKVKNQQMATSVMNITNTDTQINEYNFSYNVSDFSFDTTGFEEISE